MMINSVLTAFNCNFLVSVQRETSWENRLAGSGNDLYIL